LAQTLQNGLSDCIASMPVFLGAFELIAVVMAASFTLLPARMLRAGIVFDGICLCIRLFVHTNLENYCS